MKASRGREDMEEDIGWDGRTDGEHGGRPIRTLHNPCGRSFDGRGIFGVEVTIGCHCEQ